MPDATQNANALTATVNLSEEIDRLEQKAIPDAKAAVDKLEDEAGYIRRKHGTDSDEWAAAEDEYAELTGEVATLKSRKQMLERSLEKYGGEAGEATWKLKELSFGEIGRAQYETRQQATQIDGDPDQAASLHGTYYQSVALRLGIVDSPPAAPADPEEYVPWALAEFLYEKLENLNTYGTLTPDTDEEESALGNSSLLAATTNTSNE